MDHISLPSRHSLITLQDITVNNWKQITQLIVNRDQLGLVTSNLESLCEHQYYVPRSIVRAIVADAIPVGYIRLQQEEQDQASEPTRIATDHGNHLRMFRLLSFMIHQSYQGLGFGTNALQLLQKELSSQSREAHGIRILTTSFASVHPEDSPEHFFSALGFQKSQIHGQPLQEMIWTSKISEA